MAVLIKINGGQTGITLGWSWTPEVRALGTKNGYYEVDLTFHKQIKDTFEERIDYFSVGLGQRVPRSGLFWSSWGAGLNINKNTSSEKKLLFGGDLNFGFLSDKVRLSIGPREILTNHEKEDWSVRLMLTNIDELIWALK